MSRPPVPGFKVGDAVAETQMKPYAEIQRTVIVRETATQWITTDGSRWSKADAGRCIPRVDGLQIISIEEADRRKQGSS